MLFGITRTLGRAKVVLATRYLFSNWLSLIFRYILVRLGFSVKLIAKVDECAVELDPQSFRRLVSGFSRGLIKFVKCVNGGFLVNDVKVKDINEVQFLETWAQILGWSYNTVCDC